MAKVGLNLNINVKQIEKARLKAHSSGTYLNATVFVDLDNVGEYGDNGMITQDVTKEQKEQGVNSQKIGNVKVFWRDDAAPQQQRNAQQPDPVPDDIPDDDIPF